MIKLSTIRNVQKIKEQNKDDRRRKTPQGNRWAAEWFPRITMLRPWLYAAACTVAAMLMGVTYYLHQDSADDLVADGSYYEEVADYAMIDNMAIYASLEDN